MAGHEGEHQYQRISVSSVSHLHLGLGLLLWFRFFCQTLEGNFIHALLFILYISSTILRLYLRQDREEKNTDHLIKD